ncbi:MAG: 50S ribosomal protein L24 [Candidatus Omnitrophica bacterium]|nr:50S ribosomal protein L24 [Candidatus Omnitrophota bacterium]
MSLRIKKGDKVIVLAGKEKNKSGKVLKVFPAKNRAVVEGLNMVKKHMRRRSETEQGGIKEVPAAINMSNLALFCSSCNKGVRFSVETAKDKSKSRICKKCQKPI